MDFELHAGDLSIIRKRKMIENIEVSMDFCAKIIYVKSDLLNYVTLEQLWNERTTGLFLNSVMHLSLEQQIVCRRDLELLELCIKDTEHRFYREMLINAMQTAILDFFDFHARIYDESDISTQMPPSYIVS